MRARLSAAWQQAAAVGKQVAGEVTALDARIAQLGPASPAEAPDLRRQRAALAAERLALDASAKRAKLLELEADHLGDAMQRLDSQRFGERLSRREASPLLPAFWSDVVASLDDDLARIGTFMAAGWHQVLARGAGLALLLTLVAFAASSALLTPVRRAALRLGQRYLISDAPDHRLRRSAYALWAILIGTIVPVLAVTVSMLPVGWASAPAWTPLLFALVFSIGLAAFTAAVLGALLMRSQPNWRVAPIGAAVAERLRPLSWVLAGVSFAGSLIQAFNAVVGASPAALEAWRVVETAGSLILIGGALAALGRIRAAETERTEAGSHAGLSAIALLLWIVILAAMLALAAGYVELSQLAVTMIIWAIVVGATTYLLMRLVDDAATAVFSRSSRLGRTLVRGVGVRASAIDHPAGRTPDQDRRPYQGRQ